MSLMAWFRRNNTKLMAFVVIVLMLVFVLGPAINYLSWRRSGGNKVVAHYSDDLQITGRDLGWAQLQLEVLKLLGANVFLRPRDLRMFPSQDLRTILLGEVLFAERATGVESIGVIRQIASRGNYDISDKQINDIYAREYPAHVYWLLLVKESHLAGVQLPKEAARAQLEEILPHLAKGATYEQFIGAVVKRHNISEDQVLETFADLIAVIEYGRMMCSIQNRTIQQVLHEAADDYQTIDVEYVLFDSSTFADQARQPSEEKIVEQFEKYKGFFRGDVSEDNPYGFGYKLPERIEFEYIAVKLDDVASTIPKPTQQETEEYYQQHQSFFTRSVPSDPNDPNSPLETQTRSYAEVASLISKALYQRRLDSKAEQILLDAKSMTEANISELDSERTRPSDEQFKELAGDYEKTAAELSEKYKLMVYAGKTGLLSASDVHNDTRLRTFYLGGTGLTNVGLMRVLFAVEQLKASELGPLDARPPRLYENIGPLKDALESTEGYSGKHMMLVRVIAAEQAAEPKSMDEKLNRRAVLFDREPAAEEDANSVRELIVEDLRRLAAMDKTGEKANQFVQMAVKDGWDGAIDKFNELYGGTVSNADADATSNDEKTFVLQTRTGLGRVSDAGLAILENRYDGDPMVRSVLEAARREYMLINKLCSVLPEDANSLASPGAIVEFKPMMSYYCLKDLTVHQLYQEQLDEVKTRTIISNEYIGAQELAAVHYNPRNISKRMNFILVREQGDTAGQGDANEANTSSGPVGGG